MHPHQPSCYFGTPMAAPPKNWVPFVYSEVVGKRSPLHWRCYNWVKRTVQLVTGTSISRALSGYPCGGRFGPLVSLCVHVNRAREGSTTAVSICLLAENVSVSSKRWRHQANLVGSLRDMRNILFMRLYFRRKLHVLLLFAVLLLTIVIVIVNNLASFPGGFLCTSACSGARHSLSFAGSWRARMQNTAGCVCVVSLWVG